jgi:light-regulated signal transduction histidine kinase (bacteriophytochrome)
MKTKILKTLLIADDFNVIHRLNYVLNQAKATADFSLQITHFEAFNESVTNDFEAFDLLITTENIFKNTDSDWTFFTNLPTVILYRNALNTNNSTAVCIHSDWFEGENFDISVLKFVINEAISKNKLAQNLKKQEKEIKNQSNFIRQLTAAVSHNLQPPLVIIDRYSGLLRQRYEFSLDTIGHQFLDYISRETNHQNEQLERFLEYLQIGNEDNFIEEINVNEAIKKAIHTIEDTEDLDNQVFHVRYKDLPTVNFNRYYLVVLFGELISNAIKFRKLNHFVQIEINAKETAHNWIFEVKDSGEGFEMKNVAQVFELFKKLHNRLLYKGVGMGLPIAKKIVESYNGNIRINTEINQGTTVRFTIPKM